MFPGTEFHRTWTECSPVVAVCYIPEYATSRGRSEIKEDELMLLYIMLLSRVTKCDCLCCNPFT